MLTPASIANSRIMCCERATKGDISSSDARNTVQMTGTAVTSDCTSPGMRSLSATTMVTRARLPVATMLRRRITVAYGCGVRRYDQPSSPITSRPALSDSASHHHQACGRSNASAATLKTTAVIQASAVSARRGGSGVGYSSVALSRAAPVTTSSDMRSAASCPASRLTLPRPGTASTAASSSCAAWHCAMTA